MRNSLMQTLQAKIADVVDEYLLLGAEPDKIREVLQQEAASDLEARTNELNGRVDAFLARDKMEVSDE